jgi:uncharacterized RDD family membrane protein YckC
MEYKNYKYAGFAIRFLAHLEEMLLSGVFYFGALYLLTLGVTPENLAQKIVLTGTFILVFLFLSLPICAFYYSWMTNKFGGNLGKLIFRLRVVDLNNEQYLSKKAAFYRYVLGYIFSSKFFGLGFIQIARNNKRLAWHDELFESKVISVQDSWVGYGLFVLSIVVQVLLIILTISNILQIFQFV